MILLSIYFNFKTYKVREVPNFFDFFSSKKKFFFECFL